MEEEPKKSNPTESSSEGDNVSKDDTIENKKRPKRRFREFLAMGDIDNSSKNSKNSEVSPKTGKKAENTPSTAPDKTSGDTHEFHFSPDFKKFDFYHKLKSNKEKVLKITGGIIGIIFIISGIIYLLGASVRVADNVVFGERAVWSAFLMLVGFLIIAAVFARPLLERTFLKNIHNELEVAEDQPSTEKSSDKTSDKKEKQKDNIGENDKSS